MPVTDSPLRYPGGKTKLYSKIQSIIAQALPKENRIYIEPYAGGAGLALKLLYKNDVCRLILNDLDEHIFWFWNICLNNADALCDKIENCHINLSEWEKQRDIYRKSQEHCELDNAFATLFLNRCNVSGIIEGGPIGGMEQRGTYKLNARFNKVELIRKIKKIERYKDQIQFYNMDAIVFLKWVEENVCAENSLLNLDPPYVKKGVMLYRNSYTKDDHVEIAEVMSKLERKWIITYDESELITKLYQNYQMEKIVLGYSAGKTKSGSELIIYSSQIK